MANEKFDYSLLTPFESEGQTNQPYQPNQFDISSLQTIGQTQPSKGFIDKLPRNIMIGISNLGKNTANLPSDLARNLQYRGQQLGKSFNVLPGSEFNPTTPDIASMIPRAIDIDYAKLYGQEHGASMSDQAIQKGIEFLPELLMGGKILKAGLRRFPVTQKLAAQPFKEAAEQARKRQISNINVNPQYIQEAENLLPQSEYFQKLIADAKAGNYEPLMSLQTDVGREARALGKSPIRAESRQAVKAHELKQNILGDIKTHLESQGHEDLARLLDEGMRNYKTYIKIKDSLFPKLRAAGIPTGVLSLIALASQKGKKLLKS